MHTNLLLLRDVLRDVRSTLHYQTRELFNWVGRQVYSWRESEARCGTGRKVVAGRNG